MATAQYWSVRIKDALDHSRTAPTNEIREIYLQLVEHYRAMEGLCALPSQKIVSVSQAQSNFNND